MRKNKSVKVMLLTMLVSMMMAVPVLAKDFLQLPLGVVVNWVGQSSSNYGTYFRFVIPQDGKIDIVVNHPLKDTSDTCVTVKLTSENGASVADWNVPYNENKVISNVGLKAGTYDILMSGGSSSGTIQVNFTPADNWEYEGINDNSTGNKEMTLGKSYYGMFTPKNFMYFFGYDDDDDWYKFNVDVAGNYKITFNHEIFDTSNKIWQIDLYKSSNTSSSWKSYKISGNQSGTAGTEYLSAGTYFIKISSRRFTTVPYTIMVSDATLSALNGVDYSAVYNYRYYCQQNPDVAAACNRNELAVLTHFVNSGMKEGRHASADFDVNYYRSANPDLQAAFGNDLKAYYLHYMSAGQAEGRKASFTGTVYGGVDYSLVYNFDFYSQHNPDVAAAFNGNAEQILAHFVNNGMAEGRQASAGFNLPTYKTNNPDLVNAFGGDNKLYYIHYINSGSKEGRKAN